MLTGRAASVCALPDDVAAVFEQQYSLKQFCKKWQIRHWSIVLSICSLNCAAQHRVQSADRLPNGLELFVLHWHFQSPPSQLLVLQAIDEYLCISVQCHPHTQTP